MTHTPTVRRAGRAETVAAVLCWFTVVLEGFDLVVLGAVIPVLDRTHHLGLDLPALTAIATVSLVGVGIGAASVGPLADRFGRRITLMGCILLFSALTVLIPLAPNATTFGALRFFAGLGLGACMPAALTMMSELAPARHRAKAATLTMTGYHVGAVATALLGLLVLPNWQALFYAGGVAGLLLLPVMWFTLPETHQAGAGAAARLPLSSVLRPPYLRATLGAWIGSFMGLLLVYGLNTWLPQIMREAGYELTKGLTLLLMLNVGAVVGLVVAGLVADRRGIRSSILLWYGLAAVFLVLLSVRMDDTVVLHLVVFVTGVFVFSAQVLIYALVTDLYAPDIRGTALGLTSGVGRLGAVVGPAATGALASAGLAYPAGFYFFGLVALLALAAVAIMPARIDAPRPHAD